MNNPHTRFPWFLFFLTFGNHIIVFSIVRIKFLGLKLSHLKDREMEIERLTDGVVSQKIELLWIDDLHLFLLFCPDLIPLHFFQFLSSGCLLYNLKLATLLSIPGISFLLGLFTQYFNISLYLLISPNRYRHIDKYIIHLSPPRYLPGALTNSTFSPSL